MFFTALRKNKTEEPLEYIVGSKGFLCCKIDLSLRPFIPRPETEDWVAKAIKEIKGEKRKLSCLDIFSGSGCIGIAILKDCPGQCRRVDFAEKNKTFLKQIKTSLKLNKVDPKRYRTIQSDVFSRVQGKYDYILANPPYISTKNIKMVQKSVLDFEPHVALFGRDDGLFYIRKFLKEAKKHLNNGGKIFMEFDWGQKKEIEKLLKNYGYENYKFHKDQYGKWRWIMIK